MPLSFGFLKFGEDAQPVAYAAVEAEPDQSDTEVSKQPVTIKGWPAKPQRISKSPLYIIGDFLLLLLPVAFIALAVLAYRLDQQPLSAYGKLIQSTILLGPTLYPLVFAATGGRSLKNIALWKAEKGTTLGVLEHLIGSQTLVATVGHAIVLRTVNVLTIGLLILWALSPLGGQSALRLVHETNTTLSGTQRVFYADVDASSEFPKESYNEDTVNRVDAVLSTCLMTEETVEFLPVDTWNHPKIPRIEALERDEAQNTTSRDWYPVDKNTNHVYASLTGVSVLNLTERTKANFTIPYEYMYFDCSLRMNNGPGNGPEARKYLSTLQEQKRLQAPSAMSFDSDLPLMERGFFIFGISDGITPEKLLYGSRFLAASIFLFECSMNSILVEANIECISSTCETTRLRRLNTPRAQRKSRHLPYDVVHDGYTFKYFIGHIPGIGGVTSRFAPNPIDTYVYGNTPWSVDEFGQAPQTNWSEYFGARERSVEMSKRLTKLLNAYYDASRWPTAITRIDPFGRSQWNNTDGQAIANLTMTSTKANITRQVVIYKAEIRWIISLVICSGILFTLCLISFVLSINITAPDIFDYVSSFTRDNPYIKAPVGGSGLDGAERARRLRKLPVQLGDVDSSLDVGYLAMRSVEGEKDCEQGRVKKDRKYR